MLDVVIIIAKFTKLCIQAIHKVLIEAVEINFISSMCKHVNFLAPGPQSFLHIAKTMWFSVYGISFLIYFRQTPSKKH